MQQFFPPVAEQHPLLPNSVHRIVDNWLAGFCFWAIVNPCTPGPRLMRVHLVRNSTSAKFEKSPNIHLVRSIIHLVPIFALSD